MNNLCRGLIGDAAYYIPRLLGLWFWDTKTFNAFSINLGKTCGIVVKPFWLHRHNFNRLEREWSGEYMYIDVRLSFQTRECLQFAFGESIVRFLPRLAMYWNHQRAFN